jgi:ribonuclease HI
MGIRRSADEMGISLGEMMHRCDPVMMHTWRSYAVGCGVNDPGLLLQGDDMCVREYEELVDAGVLPRSSKSRTFYLVVRDMLALGDMGRSGKGQVHEEWHHMLEPNGAVVNEVTEAAGGGVHWEVGTDGSYKEGQGDTEGASAGYAYVATTEVIDCDDMWWDNCCIREHKVDRKCVSVDNDLLELMAVNQAMSDIPVDDHMHIHTDSMYVIEGASRSKTMPHRRRVIIPHRAEWNRFVRLVDIRCGAGGSISMSHVHSHPKHADTGLDVEWHNMTPAQKLNHVADQHAKSGREDGSCSPLDNDWWLHEAEYRLYLGDKVVSSDMGKLVRKIAQQNDVNRWRCHAPMRETRLRAAMPHMMVDQAEWVAVATGKMGGVARSMSLRAMFGQFRTMSMMHRVAPHLYSTGVTLEEPGCVGCGDGSKETYLHMLCVCTSVRVQQQRRDMATRVAEVMRDVFMGTVVQPKLAQWGITTMDLLWFNPTKTECNTYYAMSSDAVHAMMNDMLVRFNGLDRLDDCVDALHAFPKAIGAHGVLPVALKRLVQFACKSKVVDSDSPCVLNIKPVIVRQCPCTKCVCNRLVTKQVRRIHRAFWGGVEDVWAARQIGWHVQTHQAGMGPGHPHKVGVRETGKRQGPKNMCSSGKVKMRRIEDEQFAAFMIADCEMSGGLGTACSCGTHNVYFDTNGSNIGRRASQVTRGHDALGATT